MDGFEDRPVDRVGLSDGEIVIGPDVGAKVEIGADDG